MKLPKSLYNGFNLLKKSRLVLKKETDTESLEYFQKILNAAQPVSDSEITLHRFVKYLYNDNKYKFTAFIKKTNHECLILWTESKSIVQYFGLRGVAYVKWVDRVNLYSLQKFNQVQVNVVSESVDSSNNYKFTRIKPSVVEVLNVPGVVPGGPVLVEVSKASQVLEVPEVPGVVLVDNFALLSVESRGKQWGDDSDQD
jgi:hypothetical protein